MKPQYVLVINHLIDSVPMAITELRKQAKYQDLGIILITTDPLRYQNFLEISLPIEILKSDFNDEGQIADILKPFKDQIVAVICRGDKHVQYLRKVIPHLPQNVLVASPQSLAASTNKQLMRAAFIEHYPEITPKYLTVHDDNLMTIDRIEAELGYPVIVKPADLVSSLLIQSCFNRQELIHALKKTYSTIKDVYQKEERQKEPEVIVEQYLEGDFYSIDAYVLKPDELFYCPPVAYIPAKQIGIDDFFLYKRFVPTKLTDHQINEANSVTRKAIQSVGLQYSAAHVELILTKEGWKIIELGPRIGRFRQTMYRVGYEIDHSLNDLKIHLGIEPVIPAKLSQYCAAYSIYPHQEGRLRQISGLAKLEVAPETVSLNVLSQPGEEAKFAKHGGHALAEIVMSSTDKSRFDEITKYLEDNVHAIIDQ